MSKLIEGDAVDGFGDPFAQAFVLFTELLAFLVFNFSEALLSSSADFRPFEVTMFLEVKHDLIDFIE
jgi:hypothetical protein